MRLNTEIKDPIKGIPVNDGAIEIIGIGRASGLYDHLKPSICEDTTSSKVDGDQKDISMPPFANGRDLRVKG